MTCVTLARAVCWTPRHPTKHPSEVLLGMSMTQRGLIVHLGKPSEGLGLES